jgi:hypothetical protein
MTPETIPRGAAREAFEQRLRDALAHAETFSEDVRVTSLVGRSP